MCIRDRDYLVNSDAYSPLGMPEDGKSIAALLDAALRNWDGRVPLTVCPHASGLSLIHISCSFSAIRMKTFLSGSNMMVILGYS